MTWSGTYEKSVLFAPARISASRSVSCVCARCSARAKTGAANSCAPRPTPAHTAVTHSRSWYKSGCASPPLSHFCRSGGRSAFATSGDRSASPPHSASVDTASNAHRMFFL
eukprot:15844-Pelagococcus_subviridis.AAC.4